MSADRTLVVGSGVAGLMAALAAAEAGRSVVVVDKAPRLGGTSALSGGVAWLPGNEMSGGGEADRVDALAYLRSLARGDNDDALVQVFVAEAARAGRFVSERTPLSWMPIPYPDYHQNRPGARQAGRALEPAPLALAADVADRLAAPPGGRIPVTYGEGMSRSVPADEIRHRVGQGMVTMGQALVGALVTSLVDRGVSLHTDTPVESLITDGDAVVGVRTGDGELAGRVVLASGGFERDPALVRAFMTAPLDGPAGAPELTGDGLRMAMSVGADLGNMGEAWWTPVMRVPGETIGDQPHHRIMLTERAAPGSIMVDRTGRRFTNETRNYNDLGRELAAFDGASFGPKHLPCWLIVDAGFRSRYTLGPLRPDSPDPDWLVRADDVGSLAELIGVPPEALMDTVESFNVHAAEGYDPDFGRGESAYDRGIGDSRAPHPNLAPLATPPFYAVEVRLGCLGTKGGPRTDDRGRVKRVDGSVIPGLYAVGNAAASPLGLTYAGAGGTIGPALVFGMRAGEAVADPAG